MKRIDLRGRSNRHICYVESDTDRDKEYEIARKPDGMLACACIGYVFNKDRPKTCKHLLAFAHTPLTSAIVQPVSHMQKAPSGETFTFRRGISFGAVPV